MSAASRYDDPDAWVSGGHERFETSVILVRDGEHPAASRQNRAVAGTEAPTCDDPFGRAEVNHSAAHQGNE